MVEWCLHDKGTVKRIAHGYLWDKPRGTVEILCVGCGMEMEDNDN